MTRKRKPSSTVIPSCLVDGHGAPRDSAQMDSAPPASRNRNAASVKGGSDSSATAMPR